MRGKDGGNEDSALVPENTEIVRNTTTSWDKNKDTRDDERENDKLCQYLEDETNKEEGKGWKNGSTEQLVTFERLLELCGTAGRWNIMLFLMCAFCGFVSPIQTLSYQFIGATPDHWCLVQELYNSNWTDEQVLSLAIPFDNVTGKHDGCQMYDLDYAEAVQLGYEASLTSKENLAKTASDSKTAVLLSCLQGRRFNLTQYSYTIVTEWDLVCERRALYSTTFAVVAAGKLIAYLFCGYLLDSFGRRPVVLCCSALFILTGFLTAASPSVGVYIFLRTLISFCDSGFYLGCFIIAMEMCHSKHRSLVGALFAVPYALGYMVLPGITYSIRTWKILQAALSVPSLYTLVFFRYLPESPRWLILNGRYEEALVVFRWAAKVNGKKLPPDEKMIQNMEQLVDLSKGSVDNHFTKGTILSRTMETLKQNVALFITPGVRTRTFIVFYCWFSVSMVYYGIALNATNLSTDPYMYIFLGGLLELPSYLMLWVAVTRIGRKKTFVGLYFLGAICISLITAVMLLNPGGATWVTVTLSQSGKFLITAAFHLAWVYTAELFPTKYRSMAVSQASVCARIGSICSPYINDILGQIAVWAPSALFGGVSLLAAVLATTLPETKDQDLPENPNFLKKKKKKKNNNLNGESPDIALESF